MLVFRVWQNETEKRGNWFGCWSSAEDRGGGRQCQPQGDDDHVHEDDVHDDHEDLRHDEDGDETSDDD